ncbi:MAG: Fur family transcriptional regulator [Elusimicrobia bacterium]|nr:Fur family transcriptional regulator [Elusimicrobiota bacterium]
MATDLQRTLDGLRLRGFRLTRPRRLILEGLSADGAHASAEALYESLRSRRLRLGRATVFRTLKLFALLGIARGEAPAAPRRRFEVAAGKPHHDHMTCLRCGAVLEFSCPAIERLQRAEARRRGFVMQGHALEITGVCRRCAGAAARRRP